MTLGLSDVARDERRGDGVLGDGTRHSNRSWRSTLMPLQPEDPSHDTGPALRLQLAGALDVLTAPRGAEAHPGRGTTGRRLCRARSERRRVHGLVRDLDAARSEEPVQEHQSCARRSEPVERRAPAPGPHRTHRGVRDHRHADRSSPKADSRARQPGGPAWVVSCQLQPLVEPQLGQAWQLPARIIWTPHCMHIGASEWRTMPRAGVLSSGVTGARPSSI